MKKLRLSLGISKGVTPKKEIKDEDCHLMLLAALPTGEIHQVIIEKEYLLEAIRLKGEFLVIDEPLESLIIKPLD